MKNEVVSSNQNNPHKKFWGVVVTKSELKQKPNAKINHRKSQPYESIMFNRGWSHRVGKGLMY